MSSQELRVESGYSDVDETGAAMKYVHRLDEMSASPFWRTIKGRITELLELRRGDEVLDVGCGTGDDVRSLARLVGANGRAVGVDVSAAMVAEARRRSVGLGLMVEFQQADVQRLPLQDVRFDACRAERVLQHVTEPDRALGEMCRVMRPGGRIVVVEPDYGTLAIAGSEPTLTREIVRVRCAHFRSGRIGSEVPILLKKLGIGHVTVQVKVMANSHFGPAEHARLQKYAMSAVTAGVIRAADGERWLSDLAAAASAARYRHAVAIFVVSGRKP